MAAAGIQIIYSIPGLKVHAKACLISRVSGNRRGIRHYAFMSTGNFNEKTARIYSDHGFFTCKQEYTDELIGLFDYLQSQKAQVSFSKLLVTQFNMVDEFSRLIDHEIAAAKQGKKAHIIIKLNNLEDENMIEKLYKASKAGVKIDIIVRSICCLKPQTEFSENITVRRIVDTFLEHARVFIFYHGGEQKVFLSSADWMKRNLYHRIELGFPLEDEAIKEEIMHIITLQLKDNVKARILDQELNNLPIPSSGEKIRAQHAIYEYLRQKYFRVFHDD
jgi:polyphosphate kinase